MPTNTIFPNSLERLQEKADIIEYASATVMYLGFVLAQNGDFLTPAGLEPADRWAICKVESSGAAFPYVQRVLWANGAHTHNLVWDDRAIYTYLYKNWQ